MDKLVLNKEYSIDVKIDYSPNYWVSGILTISQVDIKLILYGETNKFSKYEYNESFEKLTCTNYSNTIFILLDVELCKSHHSRLDEQRGSFYDEYTIKEILFNNKHNLNINNFCQVSFKSNDLKEWIRHTKLQNDIITGYHSKKFNLINTTEISINIGNMYLTVFYPVKKYWSPSDYKAGINFSPVVNITFQNDVSFKYIRKIYYELLNLLYLLFGYDLNIEEVEVFTINDSFSYYYKQKLDRTYENSQFIPLGHNLSYNQVNLLKTPLELFKKYFKLSDFEKQFYSNFKKYRQFKYGEEKLLGYFRILENIMFKEEVLTDKISSNLLNTETRNDLKSYHINKCKNKYLKSQDCISYIKFIVYYNNLPSEIKTNLICTKDDIRKIVKLRHDITHFNEYNYEDTKIEEYIEFLEFLTIYALLKLIGFSDEHFINVKRFYPKNHLVYKYKPFQI